MNNENQLATAPTKTLKDMLSGDTMKQQFALCMPKHLNEDRFCRIAITALSKTPKLQQCDPASFFKCLLDLSALGIEPDGRRAHLIPFEDKRNNIVQCTLILDYKGIIELVLRSGKVIKIDADVVRENDTFEHSNGEVSLHTYQLGQDRGKVIGAFATATLTDGTKKSEIMSYDEIEAIRGRSKSGNNGPWVTDWNEMAKKTVFKRMAKYLPLSPEAMDAIVASDEHEFNRMKDAKAKVVARAVPIDPFAIAEGGAE